MFDKALRLMPEMCRLRRDIHAHPELGKQEQRTAALVEKTLSELPGISIRCCGTGVIAQLNGSRGMGPVVALRADMDALPLTEQTGLPYASQTSGVMHACGHDLHTAALLGCAMLLSQTEFFGQVRFLFQPDEEGDGGARQLIAAGAMDHVDAVFGWHTDPALAPGKIGIRYGTFYAASNPFDLTLHGKSAHIAHPEDGIDALETAARLLLRLKHLPQMLSDGADAVLAVGQLRGGTARNITAGEASMQGVIRSLGLSARREMLTLLEETVKQEADLSGVRYELAVQDGYIGVENDTALTALTERCARRLFGDDAVVLLQHPLLTTEDFGYYQQAAPGCFFHVGVGGSQPLHSPSYAPSEDALPAAAALMVQAALSVLSNG